MNRIPMIPKAKMMPRLKDMAFTYLNDGRSEAEVSVSSLFFFVGVVRSLVATGPRSPFSSQSLSKEQANNLSPINPTGYSF